MKLIINRIFICVTLLSISGLVFSSIYLPLERFLYRMVSAKFMVFINTLALFSFVLPFYYIVSLLEGSETAFVDYDAVVFDGKTIYDNVVADALTTFDFIKYIDTIWLIGAMIFLSVKVVMYISVITKVKYKSFVIKSDRWITAFDKLENKYSKKHILLLGSNYAGTPFTTGVVQQYIIIPAMMINSLDDEEIDFILRHEFYHASQNDVARKILIIVLNPLNWFNPLFFFLKENLFHWIEIACDEAVMENCNVMQKRKYAKLLIKSLEFENVLWKENSYRVCYVGNSIKNYKRRILEIMREKKQKGIYGKVFVSAFAVFSMVCGNVVAKAADVPVNKMFSENISVVDADETEVIFTPTELETEFIDFEFITPEENFRELVIGIDKNITYEIICEDGEVRTMQENIELNHIHTIKDAVIKVHKKNRDGSCTTTYYDGKQCTGCGFTWKGDVIKTVTEDPCMH